MENCSKSPVKPPIATCQSNIAQHCWAQQVGCIWLTCCNMLRGVVYCWLKFENGQMWANNTQHVATHPGNTSQHGGQTVVVSPQLKVVSPLPKQNKHCWDLIYSTGKSPVRFIKFPNTEIGQQSIDQRTLFDFVAMRVQQHYFWSTHVIKWVTFRLNDSWFNKKV